MVSSRAFVATRPIFPYGSRGYLILYYGIFRNEEFTTSQIKSCLSGKFPLAHTNQDFLSPANRLIDAGLLIKVKPHTYSVTEMGVRAMVCAAAYQREHRARIVSQKYVDETNNRIQEIHKTDMSIIEKLDAEDRILNEIQEKMTARLRNKQKNHKR